MQSSVAVSRITTDLSEFAANDDLAIEECTDIKHRAVDSHGCATPFLVEYAVWLQSSHIRILLPIHDGKFSRDDDATVLLNAHRVDDAVGSHARREFRVGRAVRVKTSDLAKAAASHGPELTHHDQLAVRLDGDVANRLVSPGAHREGGIN